jgi:hypothetical protein
MIFVESREVARVVPEAERPRLLDALEREGFAPLARTTRRRMIELALGPAAHTRPGLRAELEARLVPRSDGAGPLHPGDLFCFPDQVLYLVFRDHGFTVGRLSADGLGNGGSRLDEFARLVSDALAPRPSWSAANEEGASPVAFVNGPGQNDSGALVGGAHHAPLSSGPARTAAEAEASGRLAASAALEDEATRGLLRRLRDVGAGPQGTSELPALPDGGTIERLIEAGLLRRDVRVSCRRTGHALLDLPAADSLALVTASRARCGLCAAPVADEVIAETFNPTELAAALLDGAAWLRDRVLDVLASLGLASRAVAAGEVSEHGEACLLTEVCGEQFLFFVRDGDLTTEAARRAIARASDTGAAHLFAVSTGAIEDGARMRLYEFSWRRARDGRDLGVSILEGLGRARAEIGRALDAAARRKLARELSALDTALGLSAAQLVLARLKRTEPHAQRLAPATNLALQRWEAAGS